MYVARAVFRENDVIFEKQTRNRFGICNVFVRTIHVRQTLRKRKIYVQKSTYNNTGHAAGVFQSLRIRNLTHSNAIT